jgi:hypothetical protein
MDEKIAEQILKIFAGPNGLVALVLVALVSLLLTMLRESRKLREEVRYQVDRDLLERRFDAYDRLWSFMSPTAIHGVGTFEPGDVSKFRTTLSEWYFSAKGGLFLTQSARPFYFALQNLLAEMSKLDGWRCECRPNDPKEVFLRLLEDVHGTETVRAALDGARSSDDDLQLSPHAWKWTCQSLTRHLRELVADAHPATGDAIFASVQQVSSVLRTILAQDVRSRFDVRLPNR